MSDRSREAWRFARALDAAAKVPVEIVWNGSGRTSFDGWHVAWCDGPTIDGMRELVTCLADQAPSIAPLIRAYDRGSSDVGLSAALLAWLGEHPESAPSASLFMAMDAHDRLAYPDRSDDADLMRRARALLLPTGFALEALAELRDHARTGWAGVLRWLDGLSAAAAAVPDLTEIRRRRALAGSAR